MKSIKRFISEQVTEGIRKMDTRQLIVSGKRQKKDVNEFGIFYFMNREQANSITTFNTIEVKKSKVKIY